MAHRLNLLTPAERVFPLGPAPAHQHDCACCQFLGRYTYQDEPHDLYFCARCDADDKGTLLDRFGRHGDYASLTVGTVARMTVSGFRPGAPLLVAYVRLRAFQADN